MSYETFLNLTPNSLNKAIEQKYEYDNRIAHLQGLYNYYAYASCMSSASGKRSSYISEPIPITKREEEQQEHNQYEYNKAMFHAIRIAHNKKMGSD